MKKMVPNCAAMSDYSENYLYSIQYYITISKSSIMIKKESKSSIACCLIRPWIAILRRKHHAGQTVENKHTYIAKIVRRSMTMWIKRLQLACRVRRWKGGRRRAIMQPAEHGCCTGCKPSTSAGAQQIKSLFSLTLWCFKMVTLIII